MKLDNKGWGLGALIAGIGVFAIALLVVVIIVNNNLKELGLVKTKPKEVYDYTVLEKKVEEAAVKYTNKINIDNDTSLTITIKKLQNEKYLQDIYDLKNQNRKCSGYVIISKKNNKINYDPYLNCYNYKTFGYSSKFDN